MAALLLVPETWSLQGPGESYGFDCLNSFGTNATSERSVNQAQSHQLQEIPDDNLSRILAFLRAIDIANAQISSRTFDKTKVKEAMHSIITKQFGFSEAETKKFQYNTESLRYVEYRHINNLINSPEPVVGGCWISKSWVKNFGKYFETISPGKKVVSRKKARILERRYSDVLPPWPDVNCEITCEHGGLRLKKESLPARSNRGSPAGITRGSPPNSSPTITCSESTGGNGVRRRMERRLFRLLQCYYPEAKMLSAKIGDCPLCLKQEEQRKKELDGVKEGRVCQLLSSPELNEMFTRRSGVPKSYVRRDAFSEVCPLIGGIYNLVPRSWLQNWRSYIKNPNVDRVRSPETSMLLCEGHGKLLPPPHVLDFLNGQRRKLLNDLDEYSGCICEIITTEEWDSLTHQFPCDLGVSFFVDPIDGSFCWGMEQCHKCDPCYLGLYYMNHTARKISL